jgi:radical SAM protein with 4Fe4S-binding SPASM domain
MTFCPMPFTHLNIKQEGKVSACWRFPDKLGDYRTQKLQEVWNDDAIKQVRKDLLNGVQNTGCRSCWDMEKSGSISTRQQCTQTFPYVDEKFVKENISEDYSFPEKYIRSVEIRFDNICNLMCRHCSPDFSSVWEQAVKRDSALLDKMVEYGTYRKDVKHVSLTQEMVDEIANELAPNLEEIMIAGGEPLYHSKHYKFLEDMQPYAKNIRLSYNTNLNILEYKGKSVLDLWKNFKKIWLRVSIDGDPSCYEYVRAAGNLDKVEENIKLLNNTLTNTDISATCTVNLYNITRFTNIVKYFCSLDVYFHSSLVQYPEALNIKLLPAELKHQITEEFWAWYNNEAKEYIQDVSVKVDVQKQLDRIKKFATNTLNYMNSEDRNDKWQQFLDYSAALDNYHGTNLFDNYSEYRSKENSS